MLDAGLLRKAAKGPRGRHEFSLTPEGEGEVENGNLNRYLEDSLDQPPGDLESVLRLACLATVADNPGIARKLLLEARDAHRRRARLAKKRANNADPLRSRLGGLYSKALAQCEAQQEAAIADELESLRRRWDTVTKEIIQLWNDARKTQP
ncbi:MAG: hypothetical protein WAL85_08480 [Candidatus Korobacteraceae bacterium]